MNSRRLTQWLALAALVVAVAVVFLGPVANDGFSRDGINSYNRPAGFPESEPPPMKTEVTNWPFDVNVNLRVSPQVLDELIVILDDTVTMAPGET